MAYSFLRQIRKFSTVGSNTVRSVLATKEEWLISSFLITFCLCDLIVCNPPSPLRDAWLDKLHPTLDYISMLPRFNMFSPDPPKANWSLEADITFANGTTKSWHYPQLNEFKHDFWLPQIKARYQYWRAYTSVLKNTPPLAHGCAIHIARLNFNRTNPPKQVTLYLVSQDILPPGKHQDPKPTRLELEDYTVDEKDL